jgi:hypothetical protein
LSTDNAGVVISVSSDPLKELPIGFIGETEWKNEYPWHVNPAALSELEE